MSFDGKGTDPEAAALAAVTVCESLLLALAEREKLERGEMLGLLQDARLSLLNTDEAQAGQRPMADAVDMVERLSESVKATYGDDSR